MPTWLLFLVSCVFCEALNCDSLATEWDRHYCSILNQPDKYQRNCVPYRLLPGNATDLQFVRNAKGAVILYHGYSACPDAMRVLAVEMQSKGFIVLAPLMPGHGIVEGFGCEVKGACILNGTNPSFMSDSKEGYMHWVEWTVKMHKEQLDLLPYGAKQPGFRVSSIGLSAGGPTSLYALSLPDNPVSTAVLVNPYLILALPVIDFHAWGCQLEPNPDHCMSTKLLPTFINNEQKSNSTFNFSGLAKAVKSTFHGLGVWIVDHTLGSWTGSNYGDLVLNAVGIARETSKNRLTRVLFVTRQRC
jgi:pimeloyl-ACP methyl ester carboxylesterase